MKHLSYLLLCALAFVVVSCTSPEEEGTRIANELVQAQTALREGRLEVLNTFIEKFDPARFLDRKSARETIDVKLEEQLKLYEAKKLALDNEYQIFKEKFAKNTEKLARFENSYHAIVLNAPAMISNEENPLRGTCDEIILKIIPPTPTRAQLSKDLVGRKFTEECENGYFPEHKWSINENDVLDIEILECQEKQDSCSFKVIATINKPNVASWVAELKIENSLGHGDEWDFHDFSCENVMPQVTDTINESITHTIEGSDAAAVLVITNTSSKSIVVGGQTNNGSDENWVKFSVFLAPKASARIDDAAHTPIADYKIDFVEIG